MVYSSINSSQEFISSYSPFSPILYPVSWVSFRQAVRDIVSLFELDSYVPDDELIYLQPIDTWVKKVAREIGITEQKNHEKIRQDIVNCCLKAKVNPQEFNMGAWLLGAYPYDMQMWRLNRA